ncbi:GlcG/HbpS family heme-binding protein [Pseudomonas sp. SDO5271_S396]
MQLQTIAKLVVLTLTTGLAIQTPAQAQITVSNHALPLSSAVIAAQTAVDTCKANGYDVTATVVDVSGTPQVVLRGDRAVIHTKDSSFRKAYTVVTMGPIFHVDTTSAYIGVLEKYPPLVAQSLASTPNVTALPGGVAFKVGDETIAGLGVGGSPGGDKDEVCAQAGVAKVAALMKQ